MAANINRLALTQEPGIHRSGPLDGQDAPRFIGKGFSRQLDEGRRNLDAIGFAVRGSVNPYKLGTKDFENLMNSSCVWRRAGTLMPG